LGGCQIVSTICAAESSKCLASIHPIMYQNQIHSCCLPFYLYFSEWFSIHTDEVLDEIDFPVCLALQSRNRRQHAAFRGRTCDSIVGFQKSICPSRILPLLYGQLLLRNKTWVRVMVSYAMLIDGASGSRRYSASLYFRSQDRLRKYRSRWRGEVAYRRRGHTGSIRRRC